MEYNFKLQILKRENSDRPCEEFIVIESPRWYDRVFRTAVAVIWAMEELKAKVRGKEE